jgi:uncharacterized secreted repeat protein (TIGR03808 family)
MKFPRRSLLAFSPFLPVALTSSEAKKIDTPINVADAISEALASGIGILRLPAGEFDVSGVEINKPFVLEGIPGQTIFQASAPGPSMSIVDTQDVTITGINFKGMKSPRTDETKSSALVLATRVERLQIRNCTFTDSAMSGIRLEVCSGEVMSCRFSGLDEYGLITQDCKALQISGNTLENLGNGGIAVWQSTKTHDGARITNNVIAKVRADSGGNGQFGNGINVFNGANVTIANNLASDCAFSGIRCNSADNALISGNTVLRSGETALYAEFSFEGSVISGNIVDGGSAGISITNFLQGGRLATCTGNIVRNARHGGFAGAPGTGISCEADTVVNNNVIEGTDGAAIQLGWGEYCRNLSAQGNIIRSAARGITFSTAVGAGRVLIAGNMIDQPKEFAIAGMQWDKVTTGDYLVAVENPAAQVTMFGNVLIRVP